MPSLMDKKEPKKCSENNVPKSDIQKYQTKRSNVEIKKDMLDVQMRINALTRMLRTVGDERTLNEMINEKLNLEIKCEEDKCEDLKKEFTANRLYN